MFATMSCFSESLVLSPCKEINDAAATSSFVLTRNVEYVTFLHYNILDYYATLNCHQNLDIFSWKILGIKPMGLSTPLADYKTINYSETSTFTKTLRWSSWKIERN